MSDTSYTQSTTVSDSITSEQSVSAASSSVPVRQLILHGIFLFLQVLAWISTCVVFGGILMSGNISSLVSYDAYWDHVETPARAFSYDELNDSKFSNNCSQAAKGYVATQAIAFALIVITVTLTILRAIGKAESVPFIRSNTKSVNAELICTLLSMLFFFISVLVFGGGCYQAFQAADGVSVRPVGFAFTIVCFFFLFFAVPLIWFIRRDTTDENFQILGGASDTQGQAYAPPETGGFAAGAAAGGQSYGSYQSV